MLNYSSRGGEYIGTFCVCEYWQLTVDDLSCNTALELPLVILLHWLDAYDASKFFLSNYVNPLKFTPKGEMSFL